MPSFLTKDKNEILRHALEKLQATTPLTAIAPGSIVRALTEVITEELGDFYSVLDFNIDQTLVGTAQGRALDLLGSLYNTKRKTLTDVASNDQIVGAFYFELDSPADSIITIPEGTRVFTNSDDYVGSQYTYATTHAATIGVGRRRAYANIQPLYMDSVFTAGVNTITRHDFEPPVGVVVRCNNSKAIAPRVGLESDDAYRSRIIEAVRTAAGGTETAIRFTALAVPGVRDVRVRSAPYGLSSVDVVVVPEKTDIATTTLLQVWNVLPAVAPVGSRLFVRPPITLEMRIEATAFFDPKANVDKEAASDRVENAILRYMNTLLPGDSFVYGQMIYTAFDLVDILKDLTFTTLTVNGATILQRNYTPDADEMLVLPRDNITVNPA